MPLFVLSACFLLIDARIWDGGLNNAVEKTQIKFVFLLAYSYLCSTINHKC